MRVYLILLKNKTMLTLTIMYICFIAILLIAMANKEKKKLNKL